MALTKKPVQVDGLFALLASGFRARIFLLERGGSDVGKTEVSVDHQPQSQSCGFRFWPHALQYSRYDLDTDIFTPASYRRAFALLDQE